MSERCMRCTGAVVASISVLAGLATAGPHPKFTQEDLALPGKRGACFTLRDPAKSQKGTWDKNLPGLRKLKPYWNYSWGADYIPEQEKHINSECVPMLITEFAVADWNTKGDFKKNRATPDRVLAFAKSVLPWMEEQDWILGYAWFSFGMQSPQGYTSALLDYDGNLTALGRYYAGVTTENPEGDQTIEPDDADALLAKALEAEKKHRTPDHIPQ